MEVGGRRSPAYLILTLLTYLLKSRQRKILFSVRGKDVRSFHPAAGARLDTATPRYPGMAEDTAPCPRRLPSSCDLSQQANADLRPLNPLIVPMLTDLYNITMAYEGLYACPALDVPKLGRLVVRRGQHIQRWGYSNKGNQRPILYTCFGQC